MCTECLYEPEVDVKQTFPIDKLRKMHIKKQKQSKLQEIFKLANQGMKFKSMISLVENVMSKFAKIQKIQQTKFMI
ncbi:unnamed protein product [Paramecium sonneborni]|uniref:Uncharacterized protein n=1 Tax=Paramecium sonneborni TaxID=65129 RepID=A0A8S1Q7Z0_9CILI|nr:unnamed protein product [Paramecium sonneborni]